MHGHCKCNYIKTVFQNVYTMFSFRSSTLNVCKIHAIYTNLKSDILDVDATGDKVL